ncbi:MAG: glutamate--tRNA ligase [Bacteroidia bacterium]|nr:glutamate--tRNA ligase [Bacteroidia bacterium]
MTDRRVRVRFAPSPTGPLHIGGVRTALYNYLFARKHGGDFILRIEDTDQTRYVPGAENYIIEALKWVGIEPNEGVGFGDGPFAPYRQSERKHLYREYADKLLASGHAYYAFDTAEELEAMRERLKASNIASQYDAITRMAMKNSLTLSEDEVTKRINSGESYVIRIKLPKKEEVKFQDMIRGWVSVSTSQMDDKVLYKSDGMPTYHLANVVDDYLMQTTHVIRGEEWLPSAPLHVLLYRYLGWEEVMPQFAHLPLLLKPEGNGKLSKRDGDRLGFPVFPLEWKDPSTGEVSSGYRETGYFSEAVVNMLALLGWNGGTTQEVFTKEELIQAFSIERVSKHGAKFDQNKARWFNQQYLRQRDNNDIAERLKPVLLAHNIKADDEYTAKVCGLMKEKVNFPKEIWELGSYFFIEPLKFDEEVVKKRWKDFVPAFISSLRDKFNQSAIFTAAETEKLFNETLTEQNLQSKDVLQVFRLSVSGVGAGAPIFETVELLGKDRVVSRMERAINEIQIHA